MPELPEVELYTRYFERHALRQPIARIEVRDERILADVRVETFTRMLRRREFLRVRRHGKHLFADAGHVWLHLHFGMTGDLAYYRSPAEEPRFARVVFVFANGARLAYDDMRLFGIVDLTPDPDTFVAQHRLGVDPLDRRFTFKDFQRLIGKRRCAAKSFLMSQEIIAGIGNLYADELLYQTGIDPQRTVDRIAPAAARTLFTAMRRLLRDTIVRKARGDDYPPKSLVLHREEGLRCPRCGGTIRRTVVFGRTTYFCGQHQR
jgi:formamidopyrimidine-DNA glycosylase